jgi:hypothetical protein
MNRFGRVATFALAVLLAACGDAPVAPVASAPQFGAVAQSKNLNKLARYKNGPPTITIGFAMKAIGPAGGTISLAGFEVVVPPGAVSKWTNFTIRLPVDAQMSDYVWASFGPHGMHFDTPVTLRVPYSGTTADSDTAAHVMWFNGADWVELQTTRTLDGRLETLTNHFSDYGTQETAPSKGIIIVGG